MKLKLDLHIHSAHSADGCMTLEQIAARARAAGLDGIAVCDHDRVFTEDFSSSDLLIVPGVEISTEYGHLLGLFVSQPIHTKCFAESIQAIHAQGGLAVLAHPFEHNSDALRLEPIAAMLDGVETWNSRAERKNPHANAQAAAFAQKHDLLCTAGSDAHLPEEIANGVTVVETGERSLAAVKAALLKGNTTVSGRRSPARCTAKSQWIRRRKTGASPLSYLKWSLFAVKCCLQDVIKKE